ncbi:MAG: DUF6089 family protein [Prevotella sp.]|nr:DUF6089 family protein [Prevotella sp.]
MKQTLLALLCLLLATMGASAQDEPEYRLEVGGGLALTAYEGDFNGNLLRGNQPMIAAVAKYKMNPRMAWAATLGVGKLKGSSKNTDTWYPQLAENPVEFSTPLTTFDLRYEYNFWPFGTGQEYHGARPFTPFFALGAGLAFTGKPKLTYATAQAPVDPLPDAKSTVAFQLPFGLGVKYKLKQRLNITAEWMMHFTGSDRLDGVEDPYGIKSSGMFKNTDCYSTLQISLTYDLWAKCKTCMNDND